MEGIIEGIMDLFGFVPKKYADAKDAEFSKKIIEKENRIKLLEQCIEDREKCERAMALAAESIEEENRILEAMVALYTKGMMHIFNNGKATWVQATVDQVNKTAKENKVTIRRTIPVNGYQVKVERRRS